jgi:hypothetical protein
MQALAVKKHRSFSAQTHKLASTFSQGEGFARINRISLLRACIYFLWGAHAPLRASFPHNRLFSALFFALYALVPRIHRKKCAKSPILWVILRYPPCII